MWTCLPAIPYNELMDKFQELIGKVLNHHPDIKLCIIFGSIAAGKESSNSDLDIAVAAEQPLSADKYLELLEEFSAATNREIDLVDLMTATGPISKQALSTGVVVQNVNKSLYARLISRMLFNQADMMPFYDRTLRERRGRFISE
jgi:uncharacterized protein